MSARQGSLLPALLIDAVLKALARGLKQDKEKGQCVILVIVMFLLRTWVLLYLFHKYLELQHPLGGFFFY